jgi:hypothetical protein
VDASAALDALDAFAASAMADVGGFAVVCACAAAMATQPTVALNKFVNSADGRPHVPRLNTMLLSCFANENHLQ